MCLRECPALTAAGSPPARLLGWVVEAPEGGLLGSYSLLQVWPDFSHRACLGLVHGLARSACWISPLRLRASWWR